jgi:hypothetical protein
MVKEELKVSYQERLKQCMKEFAEKGYKADSLVKICREIYKERN